MRQEILRRYRTYWSSREFRFAFCLSLFAFAVSYVINTFAIHFATEKVSNPVTDIVLSNTPALPVDNLFIYGTILAVVVSVIMCFAHPKRVPFVLFSVSLFFIVRSVFTSLTHLAPFAPHLADDFGATVNRAFFGGDLFFSGHTGMPFLGALMLWKEKPLRYFYLALSLFFAVVVLLGHIHYSIDVASAFFITYGIYHMALWLFPKSHTMFMSDY